jgi:hypothetical protein
MSTLSRKLKRSAGRSLAVILLVMIGAAWPAHTNAQAPAPAATPLPRQRSTLSRSTAMPGQQATPAADAARNDAHRSPDGQFTATIPHYTGHVIMTAKDGRRTEWSWPKWFWFVGWTRDSRFAIMNYYDQYGNTWGQAFDTQKWARVELVSVLKDHISCMPTMEGDCKEGAKALLKDGSGILLYDGTVVTLADLAK